MFGMVDRMVRTDRYPAQTRAFFLPRFVREGRKENGGGMIVSILVVVVLRQTCLSRKTCLTPGAGQGTATPAFDKPR